MDSNEGSTDAMLTLFTPAAELEPSKRERQSDACNRELHGDGDSGKTVVMGTKLAVISRGWGPSLQ